MGSDAEAPPHRITIIIASFAIIATVIGSISGAYITNLGASDQWNRQISFDKTGAAQQFSIEITSMNDTLQTYAYEYSQNKDLTCGGSEAKIDPNKITVLMLGDSIPYELVFDNGSITSYRGYPNYTNVDLKSGAAIIGYNFPKAPMTRTFQSCEVTSPIIPPTLYNEHGMYYVYVKDVPKFNSKLSKNLNMFFNDIISAEADRAYLQNYLDENKIYPIGIQSVLTIKGQYFSAYMDMRMKIIDAARLQPIVLEELNRQ